MASSLSRGLSFKRSLHTNMLPGFKSLHVRYIMVVQINKPREYNSDTNWQQTSDQRKRKVQCRQTVENHREN